MGGALSRSWRCSCSLLPAMFAQGRRLYKPNCQRNCLLEVAGTTFVRPAHLYGKASNMFRQTDNDCAQVKNRTDQAEGSWVQLGCRSCNRSLKDSHPTFSMMWLQEAEKSQPPERKLTCGQRHGLLKLGHLPSRPRQHFRCRNNAISRNVQLSPPPSESRDKTQVAGSGRRVFDLCTWREAGRL